MDRIRRVLPVLWLAPLLCAHEPAPPDKPEVTACVQLKAEIPNTMLYFGEATASQLYENIGVRLRWSCSRARSATGNGLNTIVMEVVDDAPPKYHEGALAYALPYAQDGVRVTIFYDRIVSMLSSPAPIAQPSPGSILLGHVLAHELGHILSGVASHTGSGLMRDRWTYDDMVTMRFQLLGFTPDVAQFIRVNLIRAARLKLRTIGIPPPIHLPGATPVTSGLRDSRH